MQLQLNWFLHHQNTRKHPCTVLSKYCSLKDPEERRKELLSFILGDLVKHLASNAATLIDNRNFCGLFREAVKQTEGINSDFVFYSYFNRKTQGTFGQDSYRFSKL